MKTCVQNVDVIKILMGLQKENEYAKKCANEQSRLYKANNKEKISEYNKKYKAVL